MRAQGAAGKNESTTLNKYEKEKRGEGGREGMRVRDELEESGAGGGSECSAVFRSMSRLLLLVGKRRILLADAGMTAEWICLNPNLDMGVLKKRKLPQGRSSSPFIQAVGIKKSCWSPLAAFGRLTLKTLQD